MGKSTRISGLIYQGYAAILHDTSSQVRNIQAKSLILQGEHDTHVPAKAAQLLHERIPNSTLNVLPGAGHAYAFDDPAGSAAVILDWFDEHGPFDVGQRSKARRICEPYDRALALPVGQVRAALTATRLVLGL